MNTERQLVRAASSRRAGRRWDELTAADFAPLPAAEVADASVALLVERARAGGDLGGEVLRSLQKVFEAVPLRPH